MKTIIIRGVPGTGKTFVAKMLGKILPNSYVIHVDEFKLKAIKDGKSIKESRKIAYEQTLKKLELLKNKDYIILEELICEKEFLESLINLINKSKVYWFRLSRPVKKLLEIESNRKRGVKNSLEDFFKLKQDIESIKIKGEHLIKNDNLELTIKQILDIIK